MSMAVPKLYLKGYGGKQCIIRYNIKNKNITSAFHLLKISPDATSICIIITHLFFQLYLNQGCLPC